MAQRFGTGRVGACFAPIVLIYFLCNLIIAITNISRYKPTIFKVIMHLCLCLLVVKCCKHCVGADPASVTEHCMHGVHL